MLIAHVVTFALLGIFLALRAWSSRSRSVGLALAYGLGLAFNHWFGALIHTFPWYLSDETDVTRTGFEQCVFGFAAFVIGTCFVAPRVLRLFPVPRQVVRPITRRVRRQFILTGALLYALSGLFLSKIPTVSAMASCAGAVFTAGVCVFAWEALAEKRRLAVAALLLALPMLPLMTIITSGFFGYGAGAALIVVCFLFAVYLPRWQAAITFGFILLFGISFFLTYLRDRIEIREAVWGDERYAQRVQSLTKMITTFELLDFRDEDQLRRINDRLNQNVLVGKAVEGLKAGDVDYARGQTFWDAMIALVPRLFWPSKPVTAGSPGIVSYYTGMVFAEGTSVGIGQVMEGYINFGTWGVIGLMFVMGTGLGCADVMASTKLQAGDAVGFVAWFVPGIALLQPGGSMVEVTATLAASVVLTWGLGRFVLRPNTNSSPRFPGERSFSKSEG